MNKSWRDSIAVLLADMDVQDILCRILGEDERFSINKSQTFCFPQEQFTRLLVQKGKGRYTSYEANEINEMVSKRIQSNGLFRLVAQLAGEMLREMDGKIVCRHDQFLRWRDMTHDLGQIIFICAFMAQRDVREGRDCYQVSPSVVTHSDNMQVLAMLDKGFAENHHHLKGSAPAFMLSWISLMNDMRRRGHEFDKALKSSLYEVKPQKGFSNTMYTLVWKAAFIRAYLFSYLDEDKNVHHDMSNELLAALSYSRCLCEVEVQTLMGHIERLDFTHQKFDYAMPFMDGSLHADNIFSGEATFIYRMLSRIFMGKVSSLEEDLLYLYLLISIKFRRELIQCNGREGVHNFFDYQDRKDIFIDSRPRYEQWQYRYPIEKALYDDRLIKCETRIVPGDTFRKYIKKERVIRKALSQSLNQDRILPFDNSKDIERIKKLGIVFHIPKSPNESCEKTVRIVHVRYRNFKAREEAYNVAMLIKRYRETRTRMLPPLLGVDACSSELDCRPEVFAQAFRYIRKLRSDIEPLYRNKVHSLRITYHVGEDFLDIPDGLRAIDEALIFLDMRPGERIGHATAAGINAVEWYHHKARRIVLPRQGLLDNAVWMMARLREEGFLSQSLDVELTRVFNEQFNYVYRRNNHFGGEADWQHTYFNSWLLRGDAPDEYRDLGDISNFIRRTQLPLIGYNSELFLRSGSLSQLLEGIREADGLAKQLYQAYHFNQNVRADGAELVEYDVSPAYIQGVTELQKIMAYRIENAKIGIEANPTSNYLISSLQQYDKHPMMSFNDIGLINSPENPHLSVSINTDDLGVFETDLENEYMLMAASLERMENESGKRLFRSSDVYDWLDRIRQMGLSQSWIR